MAPQDCIITRPGKKQLRRTNTMDNLKQSPFCFHKRFIRGGGGGSFILDNPFSYKRQGQTCQLPGAEDASRCRPFRLDLGFLCLEQAFRLAALFAKAFLLRHFLLESRHPVQQHIGERVDGSLIVVHVHIF